MSEVMEKTFSSVSGFIMNSIGSRNLDVSPGFHNLIRNIRKARSKTEEEKAIQKELELLKLKLQQPDTSVAKIKEYLVRIMYCELLGHSASFSYIHAIKLAQQGSLTTKRVGYLAISLFLHENHELILLLVNTIQRDLSSTNMLHNCMALSAVCKLIGSEMVPAVLPLVEDKLRHPKALVRKKAVLALRILYFKAPHMVQNPDELFKESVCDRDVTVMSAALHIHSDLIKENPAAHKHLVRPLVTILRQVFQRKLSSDNEYHGVPAPWMQIKILRMLARLGAGDEHFSSLMYDLLEDIIQQLSTLSHNIAYAVQYECLVTVASIHPKESLLIKAAQCISKFLISFNYNLKYMGICALSAILKVFPSCAEEHQLTVIDCLDDADDTIRLKTLDLLFRMTTSSNVEVICEKLITVLTSTRDTFTRRDLLSKIIQLADTYQSSVLWYLDTMTQVLLISEDVPGTVVNNIISVISKDSKNGSDIGKHALELYMSLVSKIDTSNELLKISFWILGAFSQLDSAPPTTEIIGILCSQLERRLEDDLKIWVLGALTKVVASGGVVSADVVRVMEVCQDSPSMEIRQRAYELHQLCNNIDMMTEIYTKSDSADELQFDWTLSFLDQYVSDALAQGAAPYKPKQQRHAERLHRTQVSKPLFSGLNFVPYQSPTSSMVSGPTASTSTPEGRTTTKSTSPDPSLSSGASGNSAEPKASESSSGLKLHGVKKVWGQKGYTRTTRVQSHPPRVHSPIPPSSPATPSSPSRGVIPSVQLSTATAVAVSSRSSRAETASPEDIRKKELAKALFGGLHKTMTSSSNKKPLDRKPQLSVNTERSGSPHTDEHLEDNSKSSATDLLMLSELDAPSSITDPLRVQPSFEVQSAGASHGENAKEQVDLFMDGHPTLQEADGLNSLSRTDLSHPTRTCVSMSRGRLDVDEVIHPHKPNERNSPAGIQESVPRPTDSISKHNEGQSGQQRSIYEEFKGLDLSDDYSPDQRQLATMDSSSLITEHLNHDVLHVAVGRQENGYSTGDRADRSDIQGETSLSGNTEQYLDANRPISLTSVENSDPNLVETDSRLEGTCPSSGDYESTREISILDSSPGDFPFPGQPDNPQDLLPPGWLDFPRASERVQLCHDTSLGVGLCKVWKPDALGLVFHIINPNPKDAVTEITMKLDISSNLKVSINQETNPLSIGVLEPSTTAVLSTELSCISSAPSMRLGGEIAYKDHTKTKHRLFFSSPIPVSDLLRPLEFQTTEFGEQWQRHTHDCKLSVEISAVIPVSKVMTLLTDDLNIHLVEIIGNEGIACGTLLDGPICLLHVKLPSCKSLDLWIRSSSQLLSDSIAKQCKEGVLKTLGSNKVL